jgi:hypothetical protein
MMKAFVGSILTILCTAQITVPAQTHSGHEPQTFLQNQLAFTANELSSLEQGQTIVRLPKPTETREVAVFAIMRLDVPEDFFLHRMRDIVNFKKSDNVLQIGKFSDPPTLKDLETLTLDVPEIETIRQCRVSRCDFKMSAQQIERFRKEVNWSAADYRDRVTVLTREMLVERVKSYLLGGNRALGEYNDKAYALSLADEFKSLLQPASYMYGYGSEFQTYLLDFPHSRPAYVESFFYWSKEKFGLKPVITVTHVTVYRPSGAHGADILIASKGIYASHYYEASLGLTGYIHNQSPGPSRSYLMYINRSKTDALRGMFQELKRSLISGRLREATKKNMELIKQKLESEHAK